ncbi:MAG: HAD-IA family hydrolase [Rhodobacteraceae bacterium]|nr:HAD-IA family hydrolase [Paracoccaceae bacterium]
MDQRLALFDVDGTLIDSQNAIVAAMGVGFAALDRPVPDRAAVLAIVGLSLPVAVARLAPDLSEVEVDRVIAAYKAAFVAARLAGAGEASAPLYPGARAALDRLAARPDVVMGVATGKARRGLDHVYAAHGIGGYFATPSKPHPAMVLAALSDTGLSADRAVMVGDTTFDITMGRAAGVRTLAVAWGYHPVADLRAAGADLVAGDWTEVEGALDWLWGRG